MLATAENTSAIAGYTRVKYAKIRDERGASRIISMVAEKTHLHTMKDQLA